MKFNYYKKGFTLIELSIVIVIIGLIVAGIFGGQSLIKQAKLRAIVSDIESFRTAINIFKLEYDALPGDMSNASDYFPSCVDDGTNTCNGDSNKRINVGADDQAPFEDLRFWQHLQLAKLIPGNYTGLYSAGTRHEPNLTVPISPYQGKEIGYRVFETNNWAYGYIGNMIMISSKNLTVPSGVGTNSVMNSIDALSIDSKVDDDLPGSGKILFGRGGETFGSGCVSIYWSGGVNPTLLEPLDKNITCRMAFKFWFRFMLNIYVDGDACPVKDEVIRVAMRHSLEVFMVSNSYLRPTTNPKIHIILVESGADVADDWIAERSTKGDIVITADILLAQRCLEKESCVINPTGKLFTKDNIGNAVAGRSVNAHLRELGIESSNPSFSKQNRSQFLQSLENEIVQIKRS